MKVDALFVKLPLNIGVLLMVSFQKAPLFRVTSPLNECDLAVVEKFMVPVILVAPRTVSEFTVVRLPVPEIVNEPNVTAPPALIDNVAPLFTVTEQAEVCVIGEVMVTKLLPVVAIITISPLAGIVFPTQVPFVLHEPPVALLVIVAPKELLRDKNERIVINKTVLTRTFNLTDLKCMLFFYLIALQRYFGQKN